MCVKFQEALAVNLTGEQSWEWLPWKIIYDLHPTTLSRAMHHSLGDGFALGQRADAVNDFVNLAKAEFLPKA